jgi:hypothetical protein
MNKRGESEGGLASNVLFDYVAYFLFFTVFFAIMLWYVFSFQEGIAIKEDFYAKEIARMIDAGQPGDNVWIDVTPVSSLLVKHKQPLSQAFIIDNVNHQVVVSLTPKSGVSYPFFTDFAAVNVTLAVLSGNADSNRLHFQLEESHA